jgi:hypothetical protein
MVEKYLIDLDALNKYLFEEGNSETQSDVIEVYQQGEKGMELFNRQINESKNVHNDSNTTIKYDFVKILFGELLEVDDFSTLGDGGNLAFNTLYDKGIIKIIKEE